MASSHTINSNSGTNAYYNSDKSNEYYIDDVYFSQYESESEFKDGTDYATCPNNKPEAQTVNKHKSPSECIEKSNKDQKQIKSQKLPKSSARVRGALTSLYEHEDRNTPRKSGASNINEVGLSGTRGIRARQFVLIGIGTTIIMVICICAILGSRLLQSQKNARDTCLEKYIRTDNVFRKPENVIAIPKDLKPIIHTLNDCQEICSIMEGCKSFEFSETFYPTSKCLLYNNFVDEPEIVDDQKIEVDSFNRCAQGFLRGTKNTACDQGFSKTLKDYGNNISFEGCKIKCLLQSLCSDITWAPKTGRCITFAECERERETPNTDFQHYFRKVSEDCNDNSTHCDSWAKSGECSKNPAYMLEACKRSCKQCDIGDCSCSTFTTVRKGNDTKYGNCLNKDEEEQKCYVNQPSSCNDLKRSKLYVGLMFSHQACKMR